MDSKTSSSTKDTCAFVKRVHQGPLQGVGRGKRVQVGVVMREEAFQGGFQARLKTGGFR